MWWRATVIGAFFNVGLFTSVVGVGVTQCFGWYLIFLATFHLSEFVATAVTNPTNLSTDSFLLNHSLAYHVAAIASWIEFWLELWLTPTWKAWMPAISIVGVGMCVTGECLRKLAMWHAGKNFNHIVQDTKRDDHILVTTGVFAWMRHPSYVGWFMWSVGTQLTLRNPICLLGYTVTSWCFFAERIHIEEYILVDFFGDDYIEYMKKVPCGIPFIRCNADQTFTLRRAGSLRMPELASCKVNKR